MFLEVNSNDAKHLWLLLTIVIDIITIPSGKRVIIAVSVKRELPAINTSNLRKAILAQSTKPINIQELTILRAEN